MKLDRNKGYVYWAIARPKFLFAKLVKGSKVFLANKWIACASPEIGFDIRIIIFAKLAKELK